MALLSATALRAGSATVTAVYAGTVKVWPPAAPSGPAKTATFTDTFDNLTKWLTPPSTVRASGGQLIVDNTSAWDAYLFSAQRYDLSESSFHIELLEIPAGDAYGEFGYQLTSGTSVSIGIESALNRIALYGGGGASPYITYNATSMRWLRMRSAGTAVYVDTSPDATTWTQRLSLTTLPFPVTDVQLYVGGGSEFTSGRWVFDNLNITPAAPPAPAVATVDAGIVDTSTVG